MSDTPHQPAAQTTESTAAPTAAPTIFDQLRDLEQQITALKEHHAALKSSISREAFEADILATIASKVSAYHSGLTAEGVEGAVEGFTVSVKISKARAKQAPVEVAAEEAAPAKGRKGRKKAEGAEGAEGAEVPKEAKPSKPRSNKKELAQTYQEQRLTFAQALDALPDSDAPSWTKAQVEEAIAQVSALYVSDAHWNTFRDDFLSGNGSAGRGKKFGRKP